MAFIINTNFNVNAPEPIDIRLIVDRVDGVTASLVSLDTGYNYNNMFVWVREEKAFYYLIDTPSELGATVSDWTKFSGGGATGCAKSGYVSGTSFTGDPATASVVFGTPYESASYSVVVTGEFFGDALIYSIVDKNPSGFIIQAEAGGPLGATAMWITNCWDGSGLSSGGAAGAQGPTGPGGGSAIDLEEIAYGTGTGITSSNLFTFNVSRTNLIFGTNSIFAVNDSRLGRNNVIIGGCCNKMYQDDFGLGTDINKNSNILGGQYNYLKRSTDSSIIGGSGSIICGSNCSIIVGGEGNYMRSNQQSAIISGLSNVNCLSRGSGIFVGDENIIFGGGIAGEKCCRSTIIGGNKNYIHTSESSTILGGKSGSLTQSNYSSIVGGDGNLIYENTQSSIIAGSCNYIGKSGPSSKVKLLSFGNSNVIIGGVRNDVTGESKMSAIIAGYENSMTASNLSVISGYCNIIYNSGQSSIINSACSCITNYQNSGNNKILGVLFENIIIGGYQNKIYRSRGGTIIGGKYSSLTSSTSGTEIDSLNNSILFSYNSQIIGNSASRFNTIIGSTGSSISSAECSGKGKSDITSCNSLILGGSGNNILGACNSLILGGCGITIIGGTTSVISVGQNCNFNNVVAVPSLIGFGSLSLSVKTASNTTYPTGVCLDDNFFTVIAYPDDPGNLNVCLPFADALGRLYVIKKAGTSTQSTVTVRTRGSDCIDGYFGDIELINPWDYYMLQADGVDNWIKLGGAVGLNL